jgi:hypothetical protein
MHRFERHRQEFAVAGAIELDRQAQAVGGPAWNAPSARFGSDRACFS